MITLTPHLLVKCGAEPGFIDPFVPYLNLYLANSKITVNIDRMAQFLGQAMVESAAFKRTLEYASGKDYEGRKDLGNIQPGWGVRYKGRGIFQITGASNYRWLSNVTKVDFFNNPTWLERPQHAVMSACWYWDNKIYKGQTLTQLADQKKAMSITRAINGGLNHYEERLQYIELSYNALSGLYEVGQK